MPPQVASQSTGRNRKRFVIVALTVAALGGVIFLVRDTIVESRRKARAEEAIRTALNRWCSKEPIDQLRYESFDKIFDPNSADYFDEFKHRLTTDSRPTVCQITGFTREGRRRGYSTYHVAVTLTFSGGPETRLYEVSLNEKTGKCSITTKASEDISGTEYHAGSVLRAWLDTWVAGKDMVTFKKEHPEAAAKMTMDIKWAALNADGKRLIQFDFTNVTPAPGGGYRFTVTAIIEAQGKPETMILRYDVVKDRILSEGRWTIMGL